MKSSTSTNLLALLQAWLKQNFGNTFAIPKKKKQWIVFNGCFSFCINPCFLISFKSEIHVNFAFSRSAFQYIFIKEFKKVAWRRLNILTKTTIKTILKKKTIISAIHYSNSFNLKKLTKLFSFFILRRLFLRFIFLDRIVQSNCYRNMKQHATDEYVDSDEITFPFVEQRLLRLNQIR